MEYACVLERPSPTSTGNALHKGAALKLGVETLTLGDFGDSWGSTPVPLRPGGGFTALRGVMYVYDSGRDNNLYDKSLVWAITDNYGCASSFILRAKADGRGYKWELLNNEIQTLTRFEMGFAATGAGVTDALYANGNQQCKVFIKILKQVSRDDGSSWQTAPLSDSEKASLTVLPYSNELRPAQASGWYCDTAPNQYDEGLWRGTGSVGLTGSSETRAAGTNIPTEVIYRYMRFNGKEARIQPTRFMASITLDHRTQYSTHLQKEGEAALESSIIITPQSPYSLRVNDLTHTRQDAFTNADVDVDTYYWTLPGGLRILGESFSGQGYEDSKMAYAYNIVDGSWVRIGVAIKVGVTSLTLGNIDSGLKSNQSAQVPLIDSNSMLRGLRYSCKTTATNNRASFNNLMYWIITDNFGCESTFVLKANDSDKGNRLELLNG